MYSRLGGLTTCHMVRRARVEPLATHVSRGSGLEWEPDPRDTYSLTLSSSLYNARRNATRSFFSGEARSSWKTRLKNSTVSSNVSSLPSCK